MVFGSLEKAIDLVGSCVYRGDTMTRVYYDVTETPIGWAAALASDKGIRRLNFRGSACEAIEELGLDITTADPCPEMLTGLWNALESYFEGRPDAFSDLKLDLAEAPAFHKAAWDACLTIPLGETRSYGWLAAEAGKPGASRAAGQAMARNRVAVVIPCHRIVASNGALHGYGGGLDQKAALLEMERQHALKAVGV